MSMISNILLFTTLVACAGLASCGDDSYPQIEMDATISPLPLSDTVVDITYEAPGPAHVGDAKEGQALAVQRRKATPPDPREQGRRFPSRVEPITWDYERCTNARTLIPSPLDGWGLQNDMSSGEWPIGDDAARLVLTKAGDPHDPPNLGRASAGESTAFHISSGSAVVKSMQDMLNNKALRDTFYEPGPYNYPVRKGLPGEVHQEVLLGSYRVLIEGSNADGGEYFRQVIKCAIDNRLIAEGVDAATLRDTP